MCGYVPYKGKGRDTFTNLYLQEPHGCCVVAARDRLAQVCLHGIGWHRSVCTGSAGTGLSAWDQLAQVCLAFQRGSSDLTIDSCTTKAQFPQMVCDFMKFVSMGPVLWIRSTLFLTSITVKDLIHSLTFTRGLHSWADLKQRVVSVFLCTTHSFVGGRNSVTCTRSRMQR